MWNEVKGATDYRLYVSDSNSTAIRNEFFSASAICGSGTCEVPTVIPLAGEQTYTWKVRGINLAGSGPFSAMKAFTTP